MATTAASSTPHTRARATHDARDAHDARGDLRRVARDARDARDAMARRDGATRDRPTRRGTIDARDGARARRRRRARRGDVQTHHASTQRVVGGGRRDEGRGSTAHARGSRAGEERGDARRRRGMDARSHAVLELATIERDAGDNAGRGERGVRDEGTSDVSRVAVSLRVAGRRDATTPERVRGEADDGGRRRGWRGGGRGGV